jgi:hypothetical protein
MKREQMQSMLNSELSHIPRGYKGSPQNILRLHYYHFRRSDLAKVQKGSLQILEEAVKYTQKKYPDFLPKYDNAFFK